MRNCAADAAHRTLPSWHVTASLPLTFDVVREMKSFLLAVVCIFMCTSMTKAQRAAGRTAEIANALWFSDSVFVRRTMYVAGGRFTAQRPKRIDERIDLAGRFIVPPYGDAHTHAFGDPTTIGSANAVHLRHGVFYAMNLLNSVTTKMSIARELVALAGVDVVLSSAALTGPRGHPILSEEMAANGWRWDSLGFYWNALLHSHKAERDSYFVIDQPDDIARQWRAIMASRPDVVKIFLLDTDQYASMRADTTRLDASGLDPSLVPAIVAAAHRSGRRVAAHIETAADFHVAVAAGVDIVAHLPGFALTNAADSARAVIASADAALAARRGIAVIPTAWLATQRRISRGDTAQIERSLRVERQNLATLRGFGVRLAVGSDGFAETATEAAFLASLGVFSAAEVLRVWTRDTPHLVFPKRRIGRLAEGYEASLLALVCDPLLNFSCTDSITYRMRRGRTLAHVE